MVSLFRNFWEKEREANGFLKVRNEISNCMSGCTHTSLKSLAPAFWDDLGVVSLRSCYWSQHSIGTPELSSVANPVGDSGVEDHVYLAQAARPRVATPR